MISHPNCEACPYNRGGCAFEKCGRWVAWFKQEWRDIRTAARLLKKKRRQKTMNDSVSHPSHYTYGKIECIDFILDKELDFPLGNAVKYIVRAGHKHSEGMSDKDKAIQDLQKAIQYIQFEIEHLNGER